MSRPLLAIAQGRTPQRKKRTAANYLEYREQCLFVQRCELHPDVRGLPWTATMTGINLPESVRYQAKRKGVRPGFPDWMLYDPSRERHHLTPREPRYLGLALEFKSPTGKGKVSDAQDLVCGQLEVRGWRVEYPVTADEAWAILADYLNLTR